MPEATNLATDGVLCTQTAQGEKVRDLLLECRSYVKRDAMIGDAYALELFEKLNRALREL